MATHHGGKVGAAAKTLASSSTSKAAKSAAAKTLVKHQIAKHRKSASKAWCNSREVIYMASKTIRVKIPKCRISSTGAVRKIGTTTKATKLKIR